MHAHPSARFSILFTVLPVSLTRPGLSDRPHLPTPVPPPCRRARLFAPFARLPAGTPRDHPQPARKHWGPPLRTTPAAHTPTLGNNPPQQYVTHRAICCIFHDAWVFADVRALSLTDTSPNNSVAHPFMLIGQMINTAQTTGCMNLL